MVSVYYFNVSLVILWLICLAKIIQRALVRILSQLKSNSNLPKNLFLFASMKVFKNDEKCFLFHVNESSFRP